MGVLIDYANSSNIKIDKSGECSVSIRFKHRYEHQENQLKERKMVASGDGIRRQRRME